MDRYERANQESPRLLYTDRDCCSQHGPSKLKALFCKWDAMEVRLDIWHFMRRMAKGCTSESHPLYGTFLGPASMSGTSQTTCCLWLPRGESWFRQGYPILLRVLLRRPSPRRRWQVTAGGQQGARRPPLERSSSCCSLCQQPLMRLGSHS